MRVIMRKKQCHFMEPRRVALTTIVLFFQNVDALSFFLDEKWVLQTFQQYKDSENHLETQSPILIHIFPDLKMPIQELFHLNPMGVTRIYISQNVNYIL